MIEDGQLKDEIKKIMENKINLIDERLKKTLEEVNKLILSKSPDFVIINVKGTDIFLYDIEV